MNAAACPRCSGAVVAAQEYCLECGLRQPVRRLGPAPGEERSLRAPVLGTLGARGCRGGGRRRPYVGGRRRRGRDHSDRRQPHRDGAAAQPLQPSPAGPEDATAGRSSSRRSRRARADATRRSHARSRRAPVACRASASRIPARSSASTPATGSSSRASTTPSRRQRASSCARGPSCAPRARGGWRQ